MDTFFESYLNHLGALHEDIEKAIAGLQPEALDWSPGPEMNSITVLVVHLAGAERYWIGDVVCGDPSNRGREAEFRAQGLGGQALQARLADGLAYAANALESLTLSDLGKEKTTNRDGRTFSVAWALLHALEHTAIHLGQVQLTRQLWEQR